MNGKSVRRAKGTGSARERSRGKWEIRYDGPTDDHGKRKKIYESITGSRRDAERVLRERLGIIDAGTFVPKSKETVGEFMDKWLEIYARPNTELRTLQGYRHYVRRHIKPALGAIPVQNLGAPHIQALYGAMLKKGLSPNTVGQCHRILSEALSHAVKWGELVRSPSAATTPPKAKKTEVKPWDAPTFLRFLDAAKDSIFRDVYHFAVHSALRRSETLRPAVGLRGLGQYGASGREDTATARWTGPR